MTLFLASIILLSIARLACHRQSWTDTSGHAIHTTFSPLPANAVRMHLSPTSLCPFKKKKKKKDGLNPTIDRRRRSNCVRMRVSACGSASFLPLALTPSSRNKQAIGTPSPSTSDRTAKSAYQRCWCHTSHPRLVPLILNEAGSSTDCSSARSQPKSYATAVPKRHQKLMA